MHSKDSLANHQWSNLVFFDYRGYFSHYGLLIVSVSDEKRDIEISIKVTYVFLVLHELEYLSEHFTVPLNFGLLIFNELVTEPTRFVPVEAGLPHNGPLEASHFQIQAQTHSVKKF